MGVVDAIRRLRDRRTQKALAPYGPTGLQPWNQIIWPLPGAGGSPDTSLWPSVYDQISAFQLASVGRCLALIEGMIRQMPMDKMKGSNVLPRPLFLESPDPREEWPRSRFVGMNIGDYLFNGNAVSLITSRDPAGQPTAAIWIPAPWIQLNRTGEPWPRDVVYEVDGIELPRADVVHVARGADPNFPERGIGIVEQHCRTLRKASNQETWELSSLKDGAVPSVAVISNQRNSSGPELETAKTTWMSKFARREPAFLPSGSQVIPLSWSPADAQLVEARKLSLVDVANLFNLDGYWLGAPAGSMTYQSPGPMYLNLLRVTLEPILSDVEGVWSAKFLPKRGQQVHFDRLVLLRDDLATMISALSQAISSQIMTVPEARAYMGLPPQDPPPAPAPATEPTSPTAEEEAPQEEAPQEGGDQ